MARNKIIVAVVSILMGVGGALLGFNLKGAVCNGDAVPAPVSSQN